VEFGRLPTWGYGSLRHMYPEKYHAVPFVSGNFSKFTLLWGSVLAAVLGLWQTFREIQSRTWHFLLHRPVSRLLVLQAKLAAAGVVYALAILLPVLLITAWAATPGSYAGPFRWMLIAPAYLAVFAGTPIYLAALFAGLRRGHILGTRWWPLIVAVACFGIGPTIAAPVMLAWMWLGLVVGNLLLTAVVHDEMKTADFN
jgi:ABC-type transport system involved in multi-copper enzyme maturation permease subunit